MPSVVAFDPGRNVGFAVVDENGRLLDRAVLTIEQVDRQVWPADATLVVGSGTGRSDLQAALERRGQQARVVDEQGTSEIGRELWRRSEPARGWARWLPAGLRSPDRPIDDYAAWAIALRYLGVDASTVPAAERAGDTSPRI